MVDATPSSSAQGAAANATTVTVTTRQLNIQPFSISDDNNITEVMKLYIDIRNFLKVSAKHNATVKT